MAIKSLDFTIMHVSELTEEERSAKMSEYALEWDWEIDSWAEFFTGLGGSSCSLPHDWPPLGRRHK